MNAGNLTEVFCPACYSIVRCDPIHVYEATQAANHFCPPSRDPDRNRRLALVIDNLWQGNASAVYACQQCDFGFAWPHIGGDECFYRILHEQAGYPASRWEYDWTQTHILRRLPRGGTLLDIGTGEGAFLNGLSSDWARYATEGSEVTRRRLGTRGIHCFPSLEDAIESLNGSCDIVTMFQVLEHVADFRHMLTACRSLLAPTGSLIISVPFSQAIYAQERLTGCQDMTPNHVNKWGPISLRAVLEQCSFHPQVTVHEPASLANLLNAAQLKTRAQAADRAYSLAAKAFGIRNRTLRRGALAAVSLANLTSMMHRLHQGLRGTSFIAVATPA
jgi:hypothetical protein